MGAQTRPQEAPKEEKKRHRKKRNENRRQEEHQGPQKEAQKALPPFDPGPGILRVKERESSLVARGP